MKKFTLVFVLSVLTLTFASMFFFFTVAKNIPQKETTNETATENEQVELVRTDEDLGPSVYEDYSKDLYDLAIEENRVLVLYFTANWCPICREQEPINQEVFDKLDNLGAVGLRVHVLDSETTDETDALAKKFDVIYQHTFVILDKDGVVTYRFTGKLREEELTNKISEVSS